MEIRQGSLLIRAAEAEVDKVDGKVRQINLRGAAAWSPRSIGYPGASRAGLWPGIVLKKLGGRATRCSRRNGRRRAPTGSSARARSNVQEVLQLTLSWAARW